MRTSRLTLRLKRGCARTSAAKPGSIPPLAPCTPPMRPTIVSFPLGSFCRATQNRCTIGEMIGNNSCGVHALMGCKTVDNIESLDVLLYDGTRMTLGPMSEDALEAAIAEGGRAGAIYDGLKRIRDSYASLV